MKAAFILTGGIGDILLGLAAPTLWYKQTIDAIRPDVFINSHTEILDFVKTCTEWDALMCPPRSDVLKDPENPLNLGTRFLDSLHQQYDRVYSSWPDSLGQAPFAFPWFNYVQSYEAYIQTKVELTTTYNFKHPAINPNTKNIFIHPVSVTMEKNYPLPALQELINKLNGTNYNVIISRTSSWKGTPLPFFLQGKYYDLVDRPIKEVMNVLNCCDYFIGIDSAFSHIAYHLNKPRMVLQYNQNPYHVVRYHENLNHDLPLNVSPDHIFNRVMLNLKDPLTQALPAYMNIPYQTNTKQLLFKKYYD